jgi:hypothetical protein
MVAGTDSKKRTTHAWSQAQEVLMKESDWKKFKVIKEKAIEQYCSQVLEEFQEVISNTEEHVHDFRSGSR